MGGRRRMREYDQGSRKVSARYHGNDDTLNVQGGLQWS